jgi:hypothetical protein
MALLNNPITDITKAVETGGKIIDNVHMSGEEKEAQTTLRHANDMASDNWLSKTVRPITLYILLGMFVLIIVLEASGLEVSESIKGEITLLLTAAIGWYFHSKRTERIAEKNVVGNIKLKEIEAKNEIENEKHRRREERRERRAERRLERIKARNE